jgi:hypothetical protein
VHFDRFLLEREGLFLEHHVVLFDLVFLQALGPLRVHQRGAEVPIQLGGLERRGG